MPLFPFRLTFSVLCSKSLLTPELICLAAWLRQWPSKRCSGTMSYVPPPRNRRSLRLYALGYSNADIQRGLLSGNCEMRGHQYFRRNCPPEDEVRALLAQGHELEPSSWSVPFPGTFSNSLPNNSRVCIICCDLPQRQTASCSYCPSCTRSLIPYLTQAEADSSLT